ncbi:hypothetical protein CAPTEDRAFT_191143 [Capitella teleta]|uniref:Uncharacterized protein n=1 Tax=Capitella teleta TaxID=283909 RepID=R7UQ38_CAPTE|nr:hypothetical protein CAPTEDRAFT_191143 [Capitella teleta]|eukprot:ELU08624.1 hypothetical protein CAPTEDRAFT_191143 [Capitella teleta]
MALVTENIDDIYMRRSDRNPNDPNYRRLASKDRVLVSHLRQAVEGARERITHLRDDAETSEESRLKEITLRQLAEARLEQLVDMYGDPSVTEELKNRLPHGSSHQDSKRLQWQEEIAQLKAKDPHRSGTAASTSVMRERANHTAALSPAANQNPLPDPAKNSGEMTIRNEPRIDQEKQMSISREQHRQVSLLVAELEKSKNLNISLQAKVDNLETEVERLKYESKTNMAAAEGEMTDKAASLVEDIYRAQKQRDEAMLNRLRLANQERDEALAKLNSRQLAALQQLERFNIDEDVIKPGYCMLHFQDLGGLLSELTDAASPEVLSAVGRRLADAINTARQRRQEICTEELKTVLKERDNAKNKCAQLERDVLKLQQHLASSTDSRARKPQLQ